MLSLDETIANLNDKDKKRRKIVVEELVIAQQNSHDPIIQKRIGLALIESLSDDHWPVRDAAATALPYLEYEWAAKSLANALTSHKPDFVTGKHHLVETLSTLKKIGQPALLPVVDVLREDLQTLRANQIDGHIDRLVDGIFQFILSFGETSVQPLIKLLRDTEKKYLAKIVFVLVSIGEPAVAPLVQAIKDTGVVSPSSLFDNFVQVDVGKTLMRGIGGASSMGNVGPQYRDENYNEDFNKRASEAYGSLINRGPTHDGDVYTLAVNMDPLLIALIAILKGPTSNYHAAIIKAYDLLGEQAIDALIPDLESRNSFTQNIAVHLLGHLGGTAAVKAIVSVFEKGNFYQEVMDALVRLNDPEAVSSLISTYKNVDAAKRQLIIKTLSELKDERVVETLVQALNDDNLSVRKEAIQALGKLGDNSAVPILAEQLADNRGKLLGFGKRICDLASDALQKIDTPEALSALETWRAGKR